MKTTHLDTPSFWQLVFAQSKVNGGRYCEEELPESKWNWPKDTYLQQRMQDAKWQRAGETLHQNQTDRHTTNFAA